MKLHLSHPTGLVKGEITLPASKSESNRIIMIREISGVDFPIQNIASSQDTKSLLKVLEELKSGDNTYFDVGHAGTTMRFLTAYLSARDGEYVLTGSDRMKQRPIGELVNALRQLGAEISYLERDGFPPLKISGKSLQGGRVSMKGSISSQFVSALILITPLLEKGLQIVFSEEPVSKPYLQMTVSMCRFLGMEVVWGEKDLIVHPGKYQVPTSNFEYHVEGDWSSASYLFELASLAKEADLVVHGLRENSLQGDSICMEIFHYLGLSCSFRGNALYLQKNAETKLNDRFGFDFESCPDIAQTLAVTCAGLKTHARLTGLKTLRIKETDRISALQKELKKIGVTSVSEGDEALELNEFKQIEGIPEFETYHDHRMALSFAPLALTHKEIIIDDPEVIVKSYPEYWDDLRKLGFILNFRD